MASTLRTIAGALKTTLAGINGSGSYTYDLSAADQVHLGSTASPRKLPAVWITSARVPSEHNHELGAYSRRAEFAFVGVATFTSDAPGDRFLAATDLLNDVALALEADRTLGVAAVMDVILDAEADDAFTVENTAAAVVVGTIRVDYRMQTGF